MSDTVLVTGSAGFIGSHVAEHCGKLRMRVIGLDDLSGGFAENVPDGVSKPTPSIVVRSRASLCLRALACMSESRV